MLRQGRETPQIVCNDDQIWNENYFLGLFVSIQISLQPCLLINILLRPSVSSDTQTSTPKRRQIFVKIPDSLAVIF